MMKYDRWGYPIYVPAWKKKEKVEKKLEKMKKENPEITPLIVKGRNLACTWWGKAWNTNLESYADYSNRIGRGRSYLRNGFVLNLQIKQGEVTAIVQGTRPSPYEVSIKISPLEKSDWDRMKKECSGRIESLQDLLEGRFPEALAELFTKKGKGLFPSPDEITFDCSCPDWASMCKHIAAVLYGVGVKLDSNPSLFFLLRKVEIEELIRDTLNDKTKELLDKASKKTSRVIDSDQANKMFDIILEEKNCDKKKMQTLKPQKQKKEKKARVKEGENKTDSKSPLQEKKKKK